MDTSFHFKKLVVIALVASFFRVLDPSATARFVTLRQYKYVQSLQVGVNARDGLCK
jgi:hypothetical protein